MKRLELRPAARRDLLRHEKQLQRHSPRAALRMFDRLTDRLRLLSEHPLIGIENRPGHRELFVRFGKSSYVIRYQVTDDAVVITRIWHGRQNRPR
ncbi:MAG: type II toxin-antitoxin system RelE/ParE family toxin [Vitreimonas sp.]